MEGFHHVVVVAQWYEVSHRRLHLMESLILYPPVFLCRSVCLASRRNALIAPCAALDVGMERHERQLLSGEATEVSLRGCQRQNRHCYVSVILDDDFVSSHDGLRANMKVGFAIRCSRNHYHVPNINQPAKCKQQTYTNNSAMPLITPSFAPDRSLHFISHYTLNLQLSLPTTCAQHDCRSSLLSREDLAIVKPAVAGSAAEALVMPLSA